ncbi:MAG: pitrilysin family protein [Cyclobacteriaceae bacterium]
MKLLFPAVTVISLFFFSCRSGKDVSADEGKNRDSVFSLPYEKFTLDNGLQVILHEDHSDPIVALATLMHVGSSREKPGKTGFAHFFEHMSFNDSENTPLGANRKLIPEWGGVRNGGTWTDGTIYYEVVPVDAFDKILWIDSDRLGYMINTVTKEALEAEKQVVKNEKRQRVDNAPYGFTEEIIKKNLYPDNHPYHWTVIGSLPDLQAATLEDVKEFYNMYYGANNATLVIAGDIDIDETKEKVRRWFGDIRKGQEVKALSAMPVTLKERKFFYFEDSFARLPELRIVYPSVENYHKDTYALNILAELLTGSRKSPLYKIIVEEKKLAPEVSSSQNGSELAGEFIFRVRANAGTDLDSVKRSIEDGLALFEKEEFTDIELQRIKAEQETALYQGIATVLNKAFNLAEDNEFTGDPAHIIQSAKLTQAVTRSDILRVYHQYIKDKNFVMTSVVPKSETELIVEGSAPATVWQETIVAGVENEEVTRGEETDVEKTPSSFNRSEPPFGKPALFKSPDIWDAHLNNGLKVLGIENNEIPLVYFDLTIPGGHSYDALEKAGVANLLSQLLRQGTAKRTPAELEQALGLLGSSVNITCANEEIQIQAQCLARNFSPTLALVEEILLEPRWDVKEYDRLKQALETSLKGVEANAPAIASRNFYKLLYGNEHVLGLPLSGTLETTEEITMNDLQEFYKSYFSPAQSSFHITGAIRQLSVINALKNIGDKWNSVLAKMPSYRLPTTPRDGNVYFIDFPDAKQSVLFTGKLALQASHADFNDLNFANEILGAGSSGKLFQILRIEKGYTYGANSFIVKGAEISPFVINTSVRSNATLPSLLIIQSMLAEYGKTFRTEDVEITRKKVLKYNTLAFESLGSKLSILREISKHGKPKDFIEQDQQELLSMTLENFKTIIDRYMKEEDMIYLIVGDKQTQFDEVAKLKGKITQLDIHGNRIEGNQ